MKRCLLLLVATFFFVSYNIFAAIPADTPVTIKSLPPNGYLLDKGWKFYPGDDHGNSIPDAIKEKIMQPFFTTKPTGEGTGLGLSLTYDMVVKGHGGKIEVNTKEGGFTEFIVSLPV